jgi:hypothetical protein
VTITTGTNGTATLLFRAGGEVRSLVVLVGPPQPSQTPIVLAPAVGFAMPGLPSVGLMFAPVSSAASIGVAMLAAPAAVVTPVTVSSSNPSSVSVTSANPSIAAGSQVLDLAFTTGVAGTSTLTLTAGSERLQLTVVVGPAPPSTRPPFVAAPVGLSVLPSAQAGRLLVAQGAPVTARVGIQLIAAARAGATAVTITSSNPGVVGLGAGASVSTEIAAGTVTVPLDLFTSGTPGAAVLRFEFDGTAQELLVVVGNPPASGRPAITAPVIGIRIGS